MFFKMLLKLLIALKNNQYLQQQKFEIQKSFC